MIERKFSQVIYNSDWLILKALRPNVRLASKIISKAVNAKIPTEHDHCSLTLNRKVRHQQSISLLI